MNITIDHCRYTPRWETLEKMIREATASKGQLIRIARKDKGCNYRAPGTYEVGYQYEDSRIILPITLTIKGV